ncbi:AAA-domain-containing protein, partial [Clavulina sp. PMI_390]
SPILIHNISPDLQSLPFSIRRAPFGARPPPLPTAKSITVARVASPYSNNKMFQPLFLRGLKEYFDDKIRLHRMGDLIAITIHAEDARLLESVTEGEEGDEASTQELRDALLDQDVATGVVFFKITNISHDIASIQVNESPAGASDDYFAATMGELGCWVDSKVTQIIQTGLEYSRVPDVTDYLRIGELCSLSSNPLMLPTPFDKLLDLISAAFLPGAIHYGLRLSALLKGARGISKRTVVHWVARKVGIHVLEINCFDIVGDSDIKTEGTLRARFEKATESTPCIILLRHIEALARNSQTLETGKEPPMATILQECLAGLKQTWMISSYPVFAIATTSEPEKIPPGVLNSFKHEITFEAPAEAERHAILKNLLMEQVLAPDVSTKSLATQTAALVAADLVDLVHRAKAASIQRAISSSTDGAHSIEAGLVLTGADFDSALGAARSSYSESIGAPSIPNVTWDDVGGLAAVKKDILDTIQLPLDYPELFADGLKKRSGILLYGPPGTGKTLLAKAVATSCSLNFFSVKGPELLNMYIGESEANVRRVFQRARDAKPCVIFFDELDSVAPKRGNHGDSGGVMDRIVSQLLAELDGMSDGSGGSGADVFVIGATNRPDLLDSALLRPGRFDRMLYLGVSDTHEAQLNILGALTRKFRLAPDLNLKDIADQCPFNYTGADFYALCSDAMLKSMSRKAQEVDDRIAELNARPPPYSHPHPLTPQYYLAEMATPEEIDVLVSRVDFELALSELVPSVSQQEMDHYREVQKKFASDTINAKK